MLKRKWVRLLLCLFMLPLSLVLSTPGLANAAETDTVSVRLSADWIDNTVGFGDADCVLPVAIGYSSEVGTVALSGGYCKAGPDFSPLWCIGFEYDCSSYSWGVGSGAGGSDCGTADLTDGAGSHDGVGTVHTSFSVSSITVGDCEPAEICLTANPSGGDTVTSCAPTDLELPIAPDAPGCEASGNVGIGPPTLVKALQQEGNSWRAVLTASGHIPVVPVGYSPSTVVWRAYMLGQTMQDNSTIQTEALDNFGLGVGMKELFTVDYTRTNATGTGYTMVSSTGLLSYAAAEAALGMTNLHGFGLYAKIGALNPATVSTLPRANGTNPNGLYGISRADRCAYYWGMKVAEYGAPSPYDEPLGSLEPPPMPDPDPVFEPEPEDPPVDDAGWWGWLGELLKLIVGAVNKVFGAVLDVVQAIAGLAGDIVSALLDGFEDLFVPDPAVLSAEVEGVTAMWDDTAPGQYLQAIEDITPGAGAAGCDGLQLNVTLPGNVVIDESIGGACAGQMATVAGVVRGALSLTLIIGGIMACVRAVGSGLGWNPAVGRADG